MLCKLFTIIEGIKRLKCRKDKLTNLGRQNRTDIKDRIVEEEKLNGNAVKMGWTWQNIDFGFWSRVNK